MGTEQDTKEEGPGEGTLLFCTNASPKMPGQEQSSLIPRPLRLGRGGTRDHRGANKPQLICALAIKLHTRCGPRSSSAGAIRLCVTCGSTPTRPHISLPKHARAPRSSRHPHRTSPSPQGIACTVSFLPPPSPPPIHVCSGQWTG